MKPDVGDWILVEAGLPILYRSEPDAPTAVRHDRVVRVDRVEPASDTTPELVIYTDGDGSYGVDRERVAGKVVSDTLRGSTAVLAAWKAIEARRKKG